MQTFDFETSCPECSKRLLDAGDELVCPGCGITREKQVVEHPVGGKLKPRDSVRLSLGSYMGPLSASPGDRTAKGITGLDAGYEYLKTVSDFAGRDEGSAIACARLIERVGEKLTLPTPVQLEAAAMASRVLATVRSSRRITVAAASAYSLMAACRVAGVVAVSPREIIGAHLALGRRVSSSAVIQLALESPIRTFARGAEEYILRVLARLSTNPRLLERLAREEVPVATYLGALRDCGSELLRLADRTEMSGKRPCALAASALYSAEAVLSICEGRGKRVTQRELAESGDTSEYTVREQCATIFSPTVEEAVGRRLRTLPLARAPQRGRPAPGPRTAGR